jgi:exodeoxyribonuclease VII small subunit
LSERRFDEILSELEKTIAVLADGTAPLDDLVQAHQRASRLLAEGQARLSHLKARADETAKFLSE